MQVILEAPTIVQELPKQYGNLFETEAARYHFAEYPTELYVAEYKTVNGINRDFTQTTDQPCLNHRLTEVIWDVEVLSERCLDLFQ